MSRRSLNDSQSGTEDECFEITHGSRDEISFAEVAHSFDNDNTLTNDQSDHLPSITVSNPGDNISLMSDATFKQSSDEELDSFPIDEQLSTEENSFFSATSDGVFGDVSLASTDDDFTDARLPSSLSSYMSGNLRAKGGPTLSFSGSVLSDAESFFTAKEEDDKKSMLSTATDAEFHSAIFSEGDNSDIEARDAHIDTVLAHHAGYRILNENSAPKEIQSSGSDFFIEHESPTKSRRLPSRPDSLMSGSSLEIPLHSENDDETMLADSEGSDAHTPIVPSCFNCGDDVFEIGDNEKTLVKNRPITMVDSADAWLQSALVNPILPSLGSSDTLIDDKFTDNIPNSKNIADVPHSFPNAKTQIDDAFTFKAEPPVPTSKENSVFDDGFSLQSFDPLQPVAAEEKTARLTSQSRESEFHSPVSVQNPFGSFSYTNKSPRSEHSQNPFNSNDDIDLGTDGGIISAVGDIFQPVEDSHANNNTESKSIALTNSYLSEIQSAEEVFGSDKDLSEEELPFWQVYVRYPFVKKVGKTREWLPVKAVLNPTKKLLELYDQHSKTTPLQQLPIAKDIDLVWVEKQQLEGHRKIHTLRISQVTFHKRTKLDKFLKKQQKFFHPSRVDTRKSKYEESYNHLTKLGFSKRSSMESFQTAFANLLFTFSMLRTHQLEGSWRDPEIHIDIMDRCSGNIDALGEASAVNVVVKVFLLAFLTDNPEIMMGFNDSRIKGKEVVNRADIVNIRSDTWIDMRNVIFHSTVDRSLFVDKRQIILQPLDACRYEIMRFTVPKVFYKVLPIKPMAAISMDASQFLDIRLDLLLPSVQRLDWDFDPTVGRCRNIRFSLPLPPVIGRRLMRGEVAVKGTTRHSGLTGRATGPSVDMELNAGTAKYDHLSSALLWKINKLPGKSSVSIASYWLRVHVDAGGTNLDQIASFARLARLEYDMECCLASGAVLRLLSISNGHEPAKKNIQYSSHFDFSVHVHFKNESLV